MSAAHLFQVPSFRRPITRFPTTASKAGNSVTDVAAVITTTITDEIAMPARNDTSSTSSPSSATQTVPAANNTARPDVVTAVTMDSVGLSPALRPLRCRVTMNNA